MSIRLGVAAASAAILLAGCNDKITGAASQIGAPAMDINMDPSQARGLPSGTSSIIRYNYDVDFSKLGPDAFGRSGDTKGHYSWGWEFVNSLGDSISDPRLPHLKMSPERLWANWIETYGPENYSDPAVHGFEIYARVNGFEPSTTYFISLVRYGLKINGLLDQNEMLVFGKVTQPDSLYLLNPNPGGYPATNYQWVTNEGCNNNHVPVGANPLYLGPQGSISSGRITFDKCIASDTIWYAQHEFILDSVPFARNSLNPATISQQYNYLLISEGSTPGGPVVGRVQLGADEDSLGHVIPNTYWPFPTEQISPGVLISGIKVATGGPAHVQMTVVPLPDLGSGNAYRVMLIDREAGTATPAKASYYTITSDTTGKDENGNPIVAYDTSATTVAGEIPGGAPNVTYVIQVSDSLNPSLKVEEHTDIALEPPAATGGAPIWARYLDRKGTPSNTQDDHFYDTEQTKFGTLLHQANATPLLFRAAGSGQGANRGTEIGVEFQHLPRPPIGFYYAAWLVSSNSSIAPASLGVIRTPLPELASLKDADVMPNGGVLTSGEILQANILLHAADIAQLGHPLSDYQTIELTLQPKDAPASAMSPMVVLQGPLTTAP